MSRADDRAWAILVARVILGLAFFVGGVYKVFIWGALNHARLLFVQPYAHTILPVWALWASGTVIPFLELITGLLVVVGFLTRPSLFVLGAILVFVSFGHLLVQPSTSINPFILPRSALLLVVLLFPANADRFSVDDWLGRRKANASHGGPPVPPTADLEHLATRSERAWAIVVARAILGFVYFFAGVHKLSDVGATEFGRLAASQPDLLRLLPAAGLLVTGTLTPFVEIAFGVLLLAGVRVRATLRMLAILVIGITMAWGVEGLFHPTGATAMNVTVVNFYILPRAGLLIFLLLLARHDDRWSLDRLLA